MQQQNVVEGLPESKNSSFFVFDFSGDIPNNTPLHEAIAINATENALKLIDQNPQDLNTIASGNTPLLLALKKGNCKVGSALLLRDDINIDVTDEYGYRAIDYAAMLRMNTVIEMLLAKGAMIDTKREAYFTEYLPAKKPTFFKPYEIRTRSAHAEQLYQVEVSPIPLKKHHQTGQFAENANNGKSLEILDYQPYTFLVFHIADILHNMEWLTPEIEAQLTKARQAPSSNLAFATAFEACYNQFCTMRKLIPVQQNILDVFSGRTTRKGQDHPDPN